MDGQESKTLAKHQRGNDECNEGLRHTPDIVKFNYGDLCRHSHLEFLDGFKVPKFDAFGRVGNPLTHLRA